MAYKGYCQECETGLGDEIDRAVVDGELNVTFECADCGAVWSTVI